MSPATGHRPSTNQGTMVARWLARLPAWVVQFGKYGLCGVLATVVDFVVFYALALTWIPCLDAQDPIARWLGIEVQEVGQIARSWYYVLAKSLAFVVANWVAYLSNVVWVFRRGRHPWHIEISLFYAVSGTSIVLGIFLGWLLIHQFGLPTVISYAATVATSILFNFLMRKFVIFKG